MDPDPAGPKNVDPVPDPQHWSEAWIFKSRSVPKYHGSAILVIILKFNGKKYSLSLHLVEMDTDTDPEW